MEVTFALVVGARGMLSEEELERDLPGKRADLAGYLDLRGEIRWRNGPATAVFHDHVDYLASTLCVRSVPDLLAGRPVEFIFYSQPGGVRLQPEGASVRVSIGGQEAGAFPLKELVPALLACAGRVADTLERLGGDDANVLGAARALRKELASIPPEPGR
jgi:hypothetical protein